MAATTYANRGAGLETLIEHANEQYQAQGLAIIQKIATPWKVIRRGNQIVSAFPEKKSTVDFIGTYRGRPIAFDGKSTQNKTRIPLSNFEEHQIKFLLQWLRDGGESFFVVEFAALDEIYYLEIMDFWEIYKSGEKSITVKWMRERGKRLQQGRGVVLDYLEAIK
jgi:recombination protein U